MRLPLFGLLALILLLPGSVPAVVAQSYAFDDEFDEPALDTTQWVALSRGGDSSNKEEECYLPGNAIVDGGYLKITTQVDPDGCASIGTNYKYSSAMVQWSNFSFLYGTIEGSIKFAGGKGTWPSFWLLGADCQQSNITSADNIGTCNWPNPGSDEIDLAEILYLQQPTVVNETIISAAGNSSCRPKLGDVSQVFHTYTLVWAPGQLTFMIDGNTTCVLTQAVPSTPMFLMINTAMGGWQGGNVDSKTLPQTTYVKYVRVTSDNVFGAAQQ